ncbi:MAG: hypothetical protein HC773_31475, partial [Scytonema sp. CRU_2_7]|nr:hypothetical protein [Scytonema sp. CRU_2_7]
TKKNGELTPGQDATASFNGITRMEHSTSHYPRKLKHLAPLVTKSWRKFFSECEKFGFEILDDGIYHNDVKLGEVGCTNGSWWMLRAAEGNQERVACESALEAVWWLAIGQILPHAETVDCEELLDQPFEMLTALDWELLREYAPIAESRELVTA